MALFRLIENNIINKKGYATQNINTRGVYTYKYRQDFFFFFSMNRQDLRFMLCGYKIHVLKVKTIASIIKKLWHSQFVSRLITNND
jgi:hypothetical protein